jgi:cardiolipin synthase
VNTRWTTGNRFELLENGETFFPAVFDAIRQAQKEVLLETFIVFEDKVGWELHGVLQDAAQRGVNVDVLVDGFGSSDLTPAFVAPLTAAGVRLRAFDPKPRFLGMRTNVFRRMHRKIVVVDGVVAFVGGINFSADHLADYGPQAKEDHAVKVEGPIVGEIQRFARSVIAHENHRRHWFHRQERTPRNQVSGEGAALLVVRDNQDHRTDIERHYRVAIRAARKEVTIANAYFFPGYRFLKELRRAAQRGVNVRLILQGEPDMRIVKTAAEMLYDHLHRAGVRIYEYCARPLHSKVALTDDEWATVGSCNLDPLSLSLNLEANVMIRDRSFNQHLRAHLEDLIANECKEITAERLPRRNLFHLVRSFFVFHFLRRYPAWAGWLPAHVPKVVMPRLEEMHTAGNLSGMAHVTETTEAP